MCRTLRPVAPHESPSFDISGKERVLQDIVDEKLMQGVWITRSSRLRGHELFVTRSNILPRYPCHAVNQGVRARFQSYKGCGN